MQKLMERPIQNCINLPVLVCVSILGLAKVINSQRKQTSVAVENGNVGHLSVNLL